MVEVHSLTDLLDVLADSGGEDPGMASELVRKMKEKGFLFDVPVVLVSAQDRENEHSGADVLRLGETVISFDSGTVEREGAVRTLTAKEFAILRKLAENRGKIVTISALCDALWPDGSYGMVNSLIVHIRHLREKIEANPSDPQYLVTVRGLGYKLVQ